MTSLNLTGQLLIAPPTISDRRFSNAVIYIVNHSESGAWGLALNKPVTGVAVNTIMQRLKFPIVMNGEIHAGGPVDNTTVHFLHSDDVISADTIVNDNGICTSGDMAFIDRLMHNYLPKKYRVFLGACTWAPGQLEGEMSGQAPWTMEHRWLTAPAMSSVIFDFEGMEQWNAAVDLAARSAVKDWML